MYKQLIEKDLNKAVKDLGFVVSDIVFRERSAL